MRKLFIAASLVLLAACSSPQQEEPQINFIPHPTLSRQKLVDGLYLALESKDVRSAQYVALIDSGHNNIQPVHTRQNVRISLESALFDQLTSQGFQISVNSENSLSVEVQELLINVEHSIMANEMTARAVIQVTAETPAGKMVKTYRGKAHRTGTFSASDESIEEVLNDVTDLILKEIAYDQELLGYMKERF
ncbi:hypothetical protein CSW98_10855 [Vibrio sp. HA2012]|uniref:YajG family lipoprotein n=1 Tax=Vibrio sp. HA2012 TaxID=1971595 RepID=UPI000C2BF41D|nr:YajG family lipoprotein [Vibrio sp. HA2012]PJC86068.1 hypothetical protein CSW98_10855 [Vibrio sp. HA2012]